MKLLTKKEVRDRVCYSPAHIDRLEKDGKFPKRIQLGIQRVAWLESEINDWIQSRIDARDISLKE